MNELRIAVGVDQHQHVVVQWSNPEDSGALVLTVTMGKRLSRSLEAAVALAVGQGAVLDETELRELADDERRSMTVVEMSNPASRRALIRYIVDRVDLACDEALQRGVDLHSTIPAKLGDMMLLVELAKAHGGDVKLLGLPVQTHDGESDRTVE